MAGGYETPHVIIAAERENEIIAAASGNLLPVLYRRNGQGLAVMMLSYSAPETGPLSPLNKCVSTLESRLAAVATRRGRSMALSLVESEQDKVDIYRLWGYDGLENVIYSQPPLDWDENGNPTTDAVRLELMAKLVGNKAYKADVARKEEPALRKGFVRQIGKYTLTEWYIPPEEERSPEANARIEAFNQELLDKFTTSLGNRVWIALK